MRVQQHWPSHRSQWHWSSHCEERPAFLNQPVPSLWKLPARNQLTWFCCRNRYCSWFLYYNIYIIYMCSFIKFIWSVSKQLENWMNKTFPTIGIGKALCPLIQEVSSNLKPFITMCLCWHYFHCCLFKNEKGKKQSLWKGKSCSRLQRSAIVQHPFHTGLSYSSWKMFPFLSSMTLVVILCSPRNYILNFLQYKQWKLSVSCPLLIFG